MAYFISYYQMFCNIVSINCDFSRLNDKHTRSTALLIIGIAHNQTARRKSPLVMATCALAVVTIAYSPCDFFPDTNFKHFYNHYGISEHAKAIVVDLKTDGVIQRKDHRLL